MNTRAESPRVAFVVDHPQRDLAGVVLTAFEMCQRGATCHLVPLNVQHREIWSLAPQMVVLNYLRRNNERFGKQLMEAGISLAAMDTEGGVWPDVEHYAEILWQDAEVRRRVQLACMWGPHLADAMVERGTLARSQVAVTGCPRFDLYHPLWNGVTESTRDRQVPRVLINTNFSISNPRFATPEENARHLQEHLGWPGERLKDYVEAEEQAISLVIALARDLHRDYPSIEIVLRPHPFENLERYRVPLGDAPRIRIENATPVQGEIAAASVVIQRSCSTAIESGLAGVPTLSPQWVPAPWLMPTAESVSDSCASYQDLRERLDAVFHGSYRSPDVIQTAIGEVVREWFYRNDGLAHDRVSKALLQSLNGNGHVDRRRCLRHLCGLDGSSGFGAGRLGGELRYALGLSPDWSFMQFRRMPNTEWTRTGKYFGVPEVEELVGSIQRARATRGEDTRPVHVRAARQTGEYLRPHEGHSVTLFCDHATVAA
ncbi:MAG TPA: surface carbohydrate biosynthesis protein [Gemmatimonadales bacterium]|jgi:surface carbohydrate biosynthesis protein